MRSIRVVLADDHAVLRAGLRHLINAQPDMVVVGEAGDGPGAVQAAQESQPDVMVLDLTMPGGGLRGVERACHACPAVRLLVLTMHDDPSYARAARTAGASGYVAKKAADSELLSAIRSVAGPRAPAGPRRPLEAKTTPGQEVAATVFGPVCPGGGASGAAAARLSPREGQVLELLVKGYTNAEIAGRIQVGVKTVETYRWRLGQKLGLHTRADFVRHGLEAGLLSPGRDT